MSALLYDLYVVAVFAVLGGIYYAVDDLLGTAICAGARKLFKKDSLPVGEKRGWIVGKPTSKRMWPAIVLGTLSFYLIHGFFAVSVPGHILVFIVAVFGTLIGFFVGPFFSKLYSKKDQAMKYVDGINDGSIKPMEEVQKAAQVVADKVTASTSGLTERVVETFVGAVEEAGKHLPGKQKALPAAPPEQSAVAQPEQELTDAEKFANARKALEDFNNS